MTCSIVLPGGTIQLATPTGNTSQGLGDGGGQTLPTLTMTNTPGGGAIVQYAQGQDGQFFVPGWLWNKTQNVAYPYSILSFAVVVPSDLFQLIAPRIFVVVLNGHID